MTDTGTMTIRCGGRRGVALLVILLIIAAITIISLGFLSRSDIELACGQNMLLRFQMDQLANSALDHARGLLLHPQELPAEYWTGGTSLQLLAGSADYYDVSVARDTSDANDRCTYSITCEAYRLRATEKVGRSKLSAELRLDPCVALWTGADTTLPAHFTLYGDLYCAGHVSNLGAVEGDAFCNVLSGNAVTGRLRPASDLSLAWPAVTVADFTTQYPTIVLMGATLSQGTTLGPYDPMRLVHRPGSLALERNVTVDGMLLVEGDLTIRGSGVTIAAGKNLPALYASGDLIIEGVDGLSIEGLAVVDGNVIVSADATNVRVTGGLFGRGTLRERAEDSSGGDNSGLVYGSPTWRPAGGAIRGALEFDGMTDYVQTADSSTLLQLSSDYTLSVWVKPAASQNAGAALLCKTDAGGTVDHWTLQFDGSSPKRLVVQHGAENWDTGITLSEIDDGAWHHVAVVRADPNMASYLDGQPATPDPNAASFRAPGNGEGRLRIGANRLGGPGAFLFAGAMDDVRVYDSALSQNDIQRLHARQAVTSSPIGHWEFDESGSEVTIVSAPEKSAVVVWPSSIREHWMPAAGAFFRRLSRE